MNWWLNARALRLAALVLVLLGTAGCDQLTKHFARTQLDGSGPRWIAGGFIEFDYAENPGAFLSLGASLPAPARTFLFTLTVGMGLAGLLVYLLRRSLMPLGAFVGLALVCAGGMSNLVDRLGRHGLVTDFMVLRVGPVHTGTFNLADVAVVLGAVVALAALRGVGREPAGGSHGREAVDS